MELLSTRQAFGEELFELMKRDERIFALTADLGESLKMMKVREEFPQRFLDTGVAEANMAGIAAGLALGGFIPIAGTFAVFLTRAFDHIRLQVCQNDLHVIFVGSHGGVSNAADGGSAHALEDIAYMRTLPNMTIVNPVDYWETKKALVALTKISGPAYLRLYREPTAIITKEEDEFVLGKARILRNGSDVTLIATGPQTALAFEAAKTLEEKNIDAEVIAVHTIKPLDTKAIVDSVKKTKKVITIEDHSINGGLGSAVAEVVAENGLGKMFRMGSRQFGESGNYLELIKKVGIDTENIITKVLEITK
jgi:transketolase